MAPGSGSCCSDPESPSGASSSPGRSRMTVARPTPARAWRTEPWRGPGFAAFQASSSVACSSVRISRRAPSSRRDPLEVGLELVDRDHVAADGRCIGRRALELGLHLFAQLADLLERRPQASKVVRLPPRSRCSSLNRGTRSDPDLPLAHDRAGRAGRPAVALKPSARARPAALHGEDGEDRRLASHRRFLLAVGVPSDEGASSRSIRGVSSSGRKVFVSDVKLGARCSYPRTTLLTMTVEVR